MPRYIDRDEIMRQTNGGKDIFSHYFEDFEGMNKKVAIREENTPSAAIKSFAGVWRITDFGDQETINGMDGISWVMYRETLSYYESLLFIESVILKKSISGDKFIAPKWRANYSKRDFETGDAPGKFHYKFKEHPTSQDLESIGKFVTEEHLEYLNCRCLEYYEQCSFDDATKRHVVHKFASTVDYPIFVFDYGKYKKIYKPHEQNKAFRFMWDNSGEKPTDMIFGLDQIKAKNNEYINDSDDEEVTSRPQGKPNAIVKELFRCSGESDALNLLSIGCNVYWLNSETIGYGRRFSEVDELCENHYQIFDLDETGKRYAYKTAETNFNLRNVPLPGWLSNKKDFRGNPCKDIKDYINTFSAQEDAAFAFKRLKDGKARTVKFWGYDYENNRVSFSPINYIFYLEVCGFARMNYSLEKNKDSCYVFIKDKIVKMITTDNIKTEVRSFTLQWIKDRDLSLELQILNSFLTTKALPEGVLETLPLTTIELKNHSSKEEYLHFNNCSLKITADEIKRIKHSEVPNYILGEFIFGKQKISHIRPFDLGSAPTPAYEINLSENYKKMIDVQKQAKSEHEKFEIEKQIADIKTYDRFSIKHNSQFIFSQFIGDLARIHWRKEIENQNKLTNEEIGEQNLSLANIMYVMGYLQSQYKSRAQSWAVFIQDMRISAIGESSGRSGKSLIVEAIKKIRVVKDIEGRTLDNQAVYQFLYEGLTEFHDIKNIDDFSEHANFEYFYNQITGSTLVNAKHTAQVDLEYEDSGKMVFTTNFELPRQTGSTVGRILNCGVSDYYHEKAKNNDYIESRSPESKFGRLLFKDFSQEEWNKFYWFMAYCLQLYMRLPRINPPMENIERRQLRREMSNGLGRGEHFLEWANSYFEHWNPEHGSAPDRWLSNYDTGDNHAYFDMYISAGFALNDFKLNGGLPDNKSRNFSAQQFRQKLAVWCEYMGYELNPANKMDKSNNSRKIIKLGDRSEVCFYIRTKPEEAEIAIETAGRKDKELFEEEDPF